MATTDLITTEPQTIEQAWSSFQATPSYVERYKGAGVFQGIGDMLWTLQEKRRELARQTDNVRAQAKAEKLQGIIQVLLEVYGA